MANTTKTLNPISSRLYREWHALFLSWYSRRFYIDVVKRWRGFCLKYMFLLLAIVSLPLAIKYTILLNEYTYNDLLEPFLRLPVMEVHQGKAQFVGSMPYVVKDKQGRVRILIDPHGSVDQFNSQYPHLVALFTERACYFREPASPFELNGFKGPLELDSHLIDTFSFATLPDGQLSLSDWLKNSGILAIKNSLLMGVYPTIISGFWGFIMTLMVVLTLLGQAASLIIFRYRLRFKPAFRMMVVASTCSMMLFFILNLLGYHAKLIHLTCSLISLTYFCFGVHAVKSDSRNVVMG